MFATIGSAISLCYGFGMPTTPTQNFCMCISRLLFNFFTLYILLCQFFENFENVTYLCVSFLFYFPLYFVPWGFFEVIFSFAFYLQLAAMLLCGTVALGIVFKYNSFFFWIILEAITSKGIHLLSFYVVNIVRITKAVSVSN